MPSSFVETGIRNFSLVNKENGTKITVGETSNDDFVYFVEASFLEYLPHFPNTLFRVLEFYFDISSAFHGVLCVSEIIER